MSEVKWIHLNVDMFDNRKIRYLRRLPAGNDIILIWVMLLTLAGKCNAGGMIMLTQNVPYTVSMLADEFGFEENTVRLAIEAFVNLGMVSNDGFISITGWEEHQDTDGLDKIREYNRIAKQRSRDKQNERQKQLQSVTNVNDMSLTSQGQNLDPSISISISESISSSISEESEDKDRGAGEGKKADKKPESKSPEKKGVFEEFAGEDKELLSVLKDFERMRKEMKKPMTERAKRMLINKLQKDFAKEEWVATLEQSIFHGWDTVWPLRDEESWNGGGRRNGAGSNRFGGYGKVDRKDQGSGKDYSDLKYSLDPDDESTWGARTG